MVKHHTVIPEELAGQRLDKVLAELFPDYSRARLQQWIQDGWVKLDAVVPRTRDKVKGGEQVEITAQLYDEVHWQAESIPLHLIYEDDDLLIVNKPVGLVVHPGAGTPDHTLVNALLHHAPELAQLPRAGIIHRIDKDTSGILVVARTLAAHTHLVEQLQAREFLREYQTVVMGSLISGGTIDAPIGRHPTQRTHMAVVEDGKPAVTHYRIIERYRAHTHLRVKLETGRTHQIRVHFAHQRHAVVGDAVYGRLQFPRDSSEEFRDVLRNFKRQALHAEKLGLIHPRTQELMTWTAELPDDMKNLLAALALDKQQHA
jgi:23S rRNA pseudouridine1911/1915/1917 synthase